MTSLFIICQWEGLVGEVDYRVKKRGTSSAVTRSMVLGKLTSLRKMMKSHYSDHSNKRHIRQKESCN